MGKSYWFECSKCGYRAKVAGRGDQGLNLEVQTILCQECKELYDAVTQLRVLEGSQLPLHGRLDTASIEFQPKSPPSFLWAMNRLRHPGSKVSTWLKYPLQCPVSPAHKIRSWNEPDKCPRCGVLMEKAVLAYRVWD